MEGRKKGRSRMKKPRGKIKPRLLKRGKKKTREDPEKKTCLAEGHPMKENKKRVTTKQKTGKNARVYLKGGKILNEEKGATWIQKNNTGGKSMGVAPTAGKVKKS